MTGIPLSVCAKDIQGERFSNLLIPNLSILKVLISKMFVKLSKLGDILGGEIIQIIQVKEGNALVI